MTTEDFLEKLDGVKRTTRGSMARCPAHADHTPSLSVREGDDGRILLHDFGGCRVEEICAALVLRLTDLFPEQDPDPHQWRETQRRRAAERTQRTRALTAEGLHIDARRDADNLIRAARGITMDGLSDAELDRMLNALADAYEVLDHEAYDGLAGIL